MKMKNEKTISDLRKSIIQEYCKLDDTAHINKLYGICT